MVRNQELVPSMKLAIGVLWKFHSGLQIFFLNLVLILANYYTQHKMMLYISVNLW